MLLQPILIRNQKKKNHHRVVKEQTATYTFFTFILLSISKIKKIFNKLLLVFPQIPYGSKVLHLQQPHTP